MKRRKCANVLCCDARWNSSAQHPKLTASDGQRAQDRPKRRAEAGARSRRGSKKCWTRPNVWLHTLHTVCGSLDALPSACCVLPKSMPKEVAHADAHNFSLTPLQRSWHNLSCLSLMSNFWAKDARKGNLKRHTSDQRFWGKKKVSVWHRALVDFCLDFFWSHFWRTKKMHNCIQKPNLLFLPNEPMLLRWSLQELDARKQQQLQRGGQAKECRTKGARTTENYECNGKQWQCTHTMAR